MAKVTQETTTTVFSKFQEQLWQPQRYLQNANMQRYRQQQLIF